MLWGFLGSNRRFAAVIPFAAAGSVRSARIPISGLTLSSADRAVPIVSTPHTGRLEGASDRPELEAIRLTTAPVATRCKSSTCRSVTWKNSHNCHSEAVPPGRDERWPQIVAKQRGKR
jgi:hypothetical protein